MSITAPQAYRSLKGLFAVYKLPNQSHTSLIDQVTTQILIGLNRLEQRPPKCMVAFKKLSNVTNEDFTWRVNQIVKDSTSSALISENNLSIPTNVVDWFDHPLVQGPRYTKEDLVWYTGHALDYEASGVQILGLQNDGEKMLGIVGKKKLGRTYEVKGRFGLATTTYTQEGKVLERTTWNHIKPQQINKALSLIQGAHRNALYRAAEMDLSSNEAYTAACKGTLKPRKFLGPLFLNIKLIEFSAPEFVIHITCLDESCQSLRALVANIGKRLYSGAVCTKVRRISDGIFSWDDEHTLLSHKLGGVERVIEATRDSYSRLLNDPRDFTSKRNRKRFPAANIPNKDRREKSPLLIAASENL